MAKTKFCQGISDISDSYMGFILDQWGVLHDGEALFPGVVDCLKEMKERKKTILIVSNDPEGEATNKAKLKKMGLGPSLYNKIITPPVMLAEELANEEQKGTAAPTTLHLQGMTAYVCARRDQAQTVEEMGIKTTEDIEAADFLLLLGMDYPRKTLQHYEPVIRRGIQRRLKAVCLNPDSLSMIGAGMLSGPILLARRYHDAGGIVQHLGKPHKPIFMRCIAELQKHDIFPAHTVMVGDTMAHDVLGAHAAGLDTMLVKSGLHSANFSHCQNPREVNLALKNLMAVYNNVMPTYLMDELKWGKALPDRKHKKRKQPAG